MALENYVKFLRGTPSAYAALTPKDSNTLYFITAPGASVGKIYLGEILVAGNVTPDGTNVVDSLAELIDVNLAGLESGKVLGYDGEKWVPMSLPEAVTSPVMIGASASQGGSAGLVPAPQAGDQNKFLRGDGKWVEVATDNVDLSEYAKKTEVEAMIEELDEDFVSQDEVTTLSEKTTAIEETVTWGTI